MPAVRAKPASAYLQLIERFPLRPIRSEAENEKAAKICDELLKPGRRLSVQEKDYLEVLTRLIVDFENEAYPVEKGTPVELIEALMELNDLKPKDMTPYFGTQSRVSEFLAGKRRLSLNQAKKLASRFKLDLNALLRDRVLSASS